MKLFEVKTGTPVLVHNSAVHYDVERKELKRTMVFELEDVRIDPVGVVGCHRGFERTIGGAYAKAGYYGFAWKHYTILVSMDKVEVL